ncbi:MarR family transcriptional regulator [Halobacteriales archaeon QH_6_68_27]|nr:MAG: MarR family transcriptional regulator [Halobacteriales archaeon QH_6_68_27]
MDDTVELGVELLDALEHEELSLAAAVDRIETEHEELSLAAAVDRIETVTEEPALTREILETAERRGVIEREGDTVVPTTRNYVSFESDVVSKEGEFTCRRCGAGLSTGHFVRFESGEHGPFGSSCIRKVTGRE